MCSSDLDFGHSTNPSASGRNAATAATSAAFASPQIFTKVFMSCFHQPLIPLVSQTPNVICRIFTITKIATYTTHGRNAVHRTQDEFIANYRERHLAPRTQFELPPDRAGDHHLIALIDGCQYHTPLRLLAFSGGNIPARLQADKRPATGLRLPTARLQSGATVGIIRAPKI